MILPEDCRSMADVRAGVDQLDQQIVRLLGKRMRFMEAAARIKPRREQVRDEERKAVVIARAMAAAERVGFPSALAEQLYDMLVEGSIAYELERFDKR